MGMQTEPRAYRDERDLEKMLALLEKGRQSCCGTYYVHTGDLKWWLFYPSSPRDWGETIFLWDGQRVDGVPDGWALLSPDWRTFDVFVHPEVRGSRQAAWMYAWAEERIEAIIRASGGKDIRTMWVSEEDGVLASYLEGRGFSRSPEEMIYFERSLDLQVPEPTLPQGWCVRPLAGETEHQNRAAASYAAFASEWPFEAYRQRYLDFMRSPAYASALDLVAVAPTGEIAAFCICWFDPVNRTGLFEPVGTHPDFQRRGLGKSVILAGLEQMKAGGMTRAIVMAEGDYPASQRLYQSAGFLPSGRLVPFVKTLRSESSWLQKL
jgi:mycothiol synthase